MTQGLEPGFQSGYPDCGRPHVHAATRLAQIERYAEDADLARRERLHPTMQAGQRLSFDRAPIVVLRHAPVPENLQHSAVQRPRERYLLQAVTS